MKLHRSFLNPRGGAFKPRTSPYAFQGLGEEGLKIIRSVADNHGMAVTSEIMEVSQLEMFEKYVKQNTTEKGIKLIRRYYGIIGKK